MRKILLVFSLMLGLCSNSRADVYKSGAIGDSITWTLTTDSVLTIEGNGYLVSTPWRNYSYKLVKNVIIKEGIKSIPEKAFYGTYNVNLTSVSIPSSVTTIGQQAFQDCSNLKSINIPESVTLIYPYTFYGCTSLTSIQLPSNIIRIGKQAFYGCSALTTVNIPESVTEIWLEAFRGCRKLTSINIPSKVSELEESTFRDCSSLTSVTLSSGLTKIGYYVFSGDSALVSINIPESVTYIAPDVFYACTSLPVVDSVRYAGNYAVQYVNRKNRYDESCLHNIHIKEGTRWIGYNAFSSDNYGNVASIVLPSSVKYIQDGGLLRNLSYGYNSPYRTTLSVTMHQGAEYNAPYGYNGFFLTDTIIVHDLATWCNDQYRWYILQASVHGYGNYSLSTTLMYDGKELTDLVVPNGVKEITYGPFAYSHIQSVTIPSGCTIQERAFDGCKITNYYTSTDNEDYCSIDGVLYSKDKKTLVAYPNSRVGDFVVPDGVTTIGDGAFYNCDSLKAIKFPESLTSIGNSAFNDCDSLKVIELPVGFTSIGDYAFYGCDSLKTIEFPDGLTSIGEYAFYNCDGIQRLNMPKSLSKIGTSAFEDCSGISSINLNDIAFWCKNSFCSDLRTYWTLTMNGEEVTSLVIPGDATSIKDYAFYRCKRLTDLIISEGVDSIGQRAFGSCSNINSVVIPSTVTTISSGAFDCSSLVSVSNYAGNPQSIKTSMFSNYENITLHVVDGYKTAYSAATGWKSFGSIIDDLPGTAVSSITIDEKVYRCKAGETGKVTATVLPINATQKNLVWSSSDKSILYFTNETTGQFVAQKDGVVTITATAQDKSGVKGTATIIVGDMDVEQVATPTISYADNELTFSSTTDDVEYHYSISDADVKTDVCNDGKVALVAAYDISVYATKENYISSETATATLYWLNGTTETDVQNIAAERRPVLASCHAGIITIKGLEDNEQASFYTVDGMNIGQAQSVNGVVTFNASSSKAKVVIAHIGNDAIKILVK